MRRLLWWVLLLTGVAALCAVGGGRLAFPAPWHTAAFLDRVRLDGAVIAGVAVLHDAMVVAAVYLLALGLLAEVARLPHVGGLIAPVLRLPLPGASTVVWRLVGIPVVTVGITVASSSVAGALPAPPALPPALVWQGSGVPPQQGAVDPGAAPVLRLLPPLPATDGSPSGSRSTSEVPPTSVHLPSPAHVGLSVPTGAAKPSTTPPTTSPPSTASAAPTPSSQAPAVTPPPAPAASPPSSVTSSPTGVTQPSPLGAPGPPATPGRSPTSPLSSMPPTTAPVGELSSPPGTGRLTSPVKPGPPLGAGQPLNAPSGGGAASVPAVSPSAPDAPATYVLVAGDHLWAVADRTLTTFLGRAPDAHALGQYWWRLVEANRSELPDPGNPDFVLPGMTVTLPPVVG